jgi:hypothetical protein
VNLILGMLGQGPEEFRGIKRLETHTLIDADRSVQDVTWFVCTPGRTSLGRGALDRLELHDEERGRPVGASRARTWGAPRSRRR